MIHIRIDDCESGPARYECGIVGKLPDGDKWYFAGEACAVHVADCQGCNPGGPHAYGTPISQLSGRPGEPGFDRFCEIARSWGYE